MSWIQDAGHGGADPGAVAKGNTEKIYTLEAALYVDKRLGELGISSDVTRYNDSTLSQSERTSKVKKHKKAISHHYNAGGGSGFEAIHSIYSNGQFEHLLAEEFRKAGYPVRPRPVYFRKNGSGTGDYYYMHRQTGNCRTTIVEYDFVDGPQSEKIKDKAYREGMYECVIRAICREEGVSYKAPKRQAAAPSTKPSVVYEAHVQDIGWQGIRRDGQIAGTTGQRKRLEALTVRLENSNARLEMEGHIEGKGWTTVRTDGEIIGTIGQRLRLEAIKIKCNGHNIQYRVHLESIGWTDWKKNGEVAGTTGQSKRIEAIEIKLA